MAQWTGITTFPEHYFIVVPNILGNGFSSSPSNMSPPNDGPQFPLVTLYDNINLQHRLLTEQLVIEQLDVVLGWSMGGQQVYRWGALHPSMVKRIVCICGSAHTSRH